MITRQLRGHDGFTLVEMLVTLALVSLMAIYAVNALSTLKGFKEAAARGAAQGEVDAAADHMRDELSRALLRFAQSGSGQQVLQFSGKEDSIEFVVVGDGRREIGGLHLVRYAVDAKGRLVSERHFLRKEVTEKVAIVLLTHVAALELEYADTAGAITSAWSAADRMPQAVRILVRMANGDQRSWPITTARILTAE
jgi:general secretion pathway protein J